MHGEVILSDQSALCIHAERLPVGLRPILANVTELLLVVFGWADIR